MTLLTQSAVALAKVEATHGTDANPTAADDALLVSEPGFSVDPNILERDIVSRGLSPFPHIVGRKLAQITFTHEVRGNGLVQSGLVADEPMLGRLLRGCGYEAVAMAGDVENVSAPQKDSTNSANEVLTFAADATSAPTLSSPVMYTLEVTTGGASATAAYSLTNNNSDEDDLSTPATGTLTDGTAVSLGGSGASILPTFVGGGDAIIGSKFHIVVYPNGIIYRPRSTGFESLTLYLYLDGLLHKVTGAQGTFTVTAESGNYATMEFTFTGNYNTVVDEAMPADPNYSDVLPQQVELANLTWGDNNTYCAQQWTIDAANNIVPRICVNAKDGYDGVRLSDRAPSGGFDPEAVLVANGNFWNDMANGVAKTFFARVGTTQGNQTVMFARKAQTNSLGYGDRDGIRTFDVGLLFKREKGDDELEFAFT